MTFPPPSAALADGSIRESFLATILNMKVSSSCLQEVVCAWGRPLLSPWLAVGERDQWLAGYQAEWWEEVGQVQAKVTWRNNAAERERVATRRAGLQDARQGAAGAPWQQKLPGGVGMTRFLWGGRSSLADTGWKWPGFSGAAVAPWQARGGNDQVSLEQ